jgi:hypothetical protein
MKTYIGNGLLDAFVERTEEYQAEQDVDKTKAMKKDAWNRLMSYLFQKGANSSKYGSLTKKYVTDFSGGEDTYPKTLQVAVGRNWLLQNRRLIVKRPPVLLRRRGRRGRRITSVIAVERRAASLIIAPRKMKLRRRIGISARP